MISKQTIKFISSLKHSKYRLKYNCFVAEGPHLVSEFINSKFKIHSIYATQAFVDKNQFIKNVDVWLGTDASVNLITDQELISTLSFEKSKSLNEANSPSWTRFWDLIESKKVQTSGRNNNRSTRGRSSRGK